MFNYKSREFNKTGPADQKAKDKPGVVAITGAAMAPRVNKGNKQEQSAMQSEGGKS